MSDFPAFRTFTTLVFGRGALAALPAEMAQFDVSRVCLVTDSGLQAAGISGRVVDLLQAAGLPVEVFDAVEANPSFETVIKGAAVFQAEACEALIAVGGGSVMDAAKGIGLVARNSGDLPDFVGVNKVAQPLPPLLAVPTTVGTGSEVTPFAVLTQRQQRKKLVFASPYLAPQVAILDADLVQSLPAEMVAATGMDALTHAVEAVTSRFANPFSDSLALAAIQRIAADLPAAVRGETAARESMLYASTMAGQAFSISRVGLVHGMSHPVSSYYGVPHGLANAILLPHVLAFNAPACAAQLVKIGIVMGVTATAEAVIETVRELGAQIGIPAGLRQVGVDETFLAEMTQDAFESGNAQIVNPRRPTLAEVETLYQAAL